ncbi:thioesterase [Mycobacterium sp. 852002-53434_SCH5985345]|uniref:PaaI family thioesterase n=1 Tax=unclassified Mycobacterium TaxID=2642494 RepID=UPI0007FC0C53|nr:MULTISPECIES: PaaI family thioesterase [unclassified Mycobacterium]OBF53800.1 thioesterase [Mycobacterium sp. 852002-53434_SCH5985345]OBF76057.1 thioesterase [Mycobacterium sp. 852002-51613_SCH5001154]OBF95440.1 thioesterase [Mycobacterium sp. 852014-52450_SCH5900713]
MKGNDDSGAPAYEALTQSVRRLIDATIRTEADTGTVAAAKTHIDCAIEQLSESLMPGSFGVRHPFDGQPVASGNVVIGVRNPIAPPLVIHRDAGGAVWTEITLGAAYEGPPGHVHGGVCALVLDHVLGATAHEPGRPAYTGTLTLRYVRGTPLGLVRAEAWVERVEGVKTFAKGQITDSQGLTVGAEGVFIKPRGAHD